MDEFVGLVVQSVNGNLDKELAHLAWTALAAICSVVGSVVSVALGVVVKRALTKFFARQDRLVAEQEEIKKRVAAIESAVGLKATSGNRPSDGDGYAVL